MSLHNTMRVTDPDHSAVDVYMDEGSVVIRQENARIIVSQQQMYELGLIGTRIDRLKVAV